MRIVAVSDVTGEHLPDVVVTNSDQIVVFPGTCE